jgi:enoyl-CoA hydratase/carnithine racemase
LSITLTRPKALNALTIDMCRNLNNLLDGTGGINSPTSNVGAFLVQGGGSGGGREKLLGKPSGSGKAFCAGGDVKSIWEELVALKSKAGNGNGAGACVGAGTETGAATGADVGTGTPGYLHSDFFREEYILNYTLQVSQ